DRETPICRHSEQSRRAVDDLASARRRLIGTSRAPKQRCINVGETVAGPLNTWTGHELGDARLLDRLADCMHRLVPDRRAVVPRALLSPGPVARPNDSCVTSTPADAGSSNRPN